MADNCLLDWSKYCKTIFPYSWAVFANSFVATSWIALLKYICRRLLTNEKSWYLVVSSTAWRTCDLLLWCRSSLEHITYCILLVGAAVSGTVRLSIYPFTGVFLAFPSFFIFYFYFYSFTIKIFFFIFLLIYLFFSFFFFFSLLISSPLSFSPLASFSSEYVFL